MNYEDCIRQGILTKQPPDHLRAKQLRKLAQIRKEFWEKATTEHVQLHIEAYYEICKELLFARLYAKGFNCTNHLCLLSWCKEENILSSRMIAKIDELRKVRNEVIYRGEIVSTNYLMQNKPFFEKIIAILEKETA